jgi:hypothetical protein
LQKIEISGKSVDDALVSYVQENGGIIATIDAKLKTRIKKSGGSVLSVSNDKIVLEPSKLFFWLNKICIVFEYHGIKINWLGHDSFSL